MTTRLAVIYYSATGSVHALAEAVADGARSSGAEVRLRRVPELAGEEAIDANPAWRNYVDATRNSVAEATLADLEWADAYAFGTPTRFGLPAAQLKQFLAPGYTDPVLFAAGGNPYGTSSSGNDGAPSPAVLVAARYQGRLVADVANRLAAGARAASVTGDAA